MECVNYLSSILDKLKVQWPNNYTCNIVCHGHSVPAGYFATPFVNTFEAYPHLLHKGIKERFPFAVTNVIVTAIGGENSLSGAERFGKEVLNHSPHIVTIDYGLNDRGIDKASVKCAWESMIYQALEKDIKVILLTPSWDNSYFEKSISFYQLEEQAIQIRELANSYNVGLADVFLVFDNYVKKDSDLVDLLSHVNHPSGIGHELIAKELLKFFLAR